MRERDGSSICWITPQMSAVGRAGQVQSQQLGASGSASWVQGLKDLGHLQLLSWSINRDLDLKWSSHESNQFRGLTCTKVPSSDCQVFCCCYCCLFFFLKHSRILVGSALTLLRRIDVLEKPSLRITVTLYLHWLSMRALWYICAPSFCSILYGC